MVEGSAWGRAGGMLRLPRSGREVRETHEAPHGEGQWAGHSSWRVGQIPAGGERGLYLQNKEEDTSTEFPSRGERI